jgi:hypothetical protein
MPTKQSIGMEELRDREVVGRSEPEGRAEPDDLARGLAGRGRSDRALRQGSSRRRSTAPGGGCRSASCPPRSASG